MVIKMRKKLLILCNHEIVLYNFKKELILLLAQNEFEITISMPFSKNLAYFESLGCECIETNIDRRGLNPITDLKLVWTYHKLIKKKRPDILFTLTIKPTIYGGILSRLHDLDLIVNITGIGTSFQKGSILKNVVTCLYKFALKKCKFCFFENKGNERVFLENHIIQSSQSVVVNGAGVNLKEFTFLPSVEKPNLVFTFIGRIMKEKGIDEFLYVVDKLKDLPIEFRVYGFCEDAYESILESYNQLNNFTYYGFVDNVKEVYDATDCIILPSYHEGMSNVNLEAAAVGCAVITSNIPGCKEAIINGKTGFLVNPKDKNDLFDKVTDFYKLSYDERKQMSLNARSHMEDFFNRDVINHSYLKAFDSLGDPNE